MSITLGPIRQDSQLSVYELIWMDKSRILHQPLLRWAEKMCTDVLFSQWAEAAGRRMKYLTHFPAGNGQKKERGTQSRPRNANIQVELPREGSGMWGCPTELFLPISGFHSVQFYLTSQTCAHSLTYFCTLSVLLCPNSW